MHLPDEMEAKEIQLLLSFCMKESTHGFCSNLYFNGMASKYPWHFISFSKLFGTFPLKRKSIGDDMRNKTKGIREYILRAPLQHDERILMETFMKEFESIVEREIQEINKL